MIRESEPLLQILLDNRVLLPSILCRSVCKSWLLGIDSRRTSVFVRCLEPERAPGGCVGGTQSLPSVALGRFLSKLPSLQAVHFAPSFRKVRTFLDGAASSQHSFGERKHEREGVGGGRTVGAWEKVEEREAQENAHRMDRAGWGAARVSAAAGSDGAERMSLRMMEQQRIDHACAALQSKKVAEVAVPFCALSVEQLGALLRALGTPAGDGKPTLRCLDVSGNWCQVEGARLLAGALQADLAGVTQLDISSNDVTEAGIEILAEALLCPQAARLTTLKLGESSFASGPRVPRALSSLIRSCPALSSLYITADSLKRGLGSFFSALAAAPHLRCLHLTKCSLEADAGADLVERLALEARVLEELSLKDNQLSCAVAETLVFSIRDRVAASGCTFPLTSLDLSNNLLGPEGCAAIAALLRADQSALSAPLAHLRYLNLAENQIRQRGCAALADAMRHNATLETLVLHSNGLQAGGATALSESLCLPAAAGALTSLDISHNAMDARGISALAVATAACPQLQALDVSFNSASWEGLAALGDAFADVRAAVAAGHRDSPHLRRLNLAYNSAVPPPDAEGEIPWLASLLSACPRLEYLDLSYNILGDGPPLTLAASLKDVRAGGIEGGWRELGMRGIGMHAEALNVLLGALSRSHRTSLRLEALHVADNHATEEFGASAAPQDADCDGVSGGEQEARSAESGAHVWRCQDDHGDDSVGMGVWNSSGEGETSQKEREREVFSSRREDFERYYGEQVDVWLGGGERTAEKEFDRDANVRVLLDAAGARGLAPHQVSLR